MKEVDYIGILRLKHLGYSQNKISASVNSSHHTVKNVLETASEKGIHWPIDKNITNRDLELILFPDKYKKVCLYVEPDYPYIHRELAKRGVTMTLLWEEYCSKCHAEGRTPYQSTHFVLFVKDVVRIFSKRFRGGMSALCAHIPFNQPFDLVTHGFGAGGAEME